MISFHQSVHQLNFRYMFHFFEMLSDFPRYVLLFLQECRLSFLSEKKIYVIIQYRYVDMSSHTRKRMFFDYMDCNLFHCCLTCYCL